jgi:hypothetical protein
MIRPLITAKEAKSLKKRALAVREEFKALGINFATNHKAAYSFKKLDKRIAH